MTCGISMIEDLTPTELKVLEIISEGYNNERASELLYINTKTLEHHANSIYSKLEIPKDRNKRVMATRYYLTYKGITKED